VLANWEILDAATAARKRLLWAGFLPIPATGKKPPIAGWTDLVATEADIESWFNRFPEALNTGVLTLTTPAVDIDVYDYDVAKEIEALLWETIGSRGMVRFGQPPKRAVLFRTETRSGKFQRRSSLRRRSSGTGSRCCATASRSWCWAHIRAPASPTPGTAVSPAMWPAPICQNSPKT
jgi:hypothetical protein